MAMSTLGIYHSELYRISGGQKEEEEDNRTVNTTHSSVTVQHSNVSEFAMERNAKDSLGDLLTEIGAHVSFLLETLSLVTAVRNAAQQRGVDVTNLSDEDIIQQAREFVQRQPPPPQDVIARNDETSADAVSSLDSSSSRPADGSAHAADDLMNQSIGTISIPQSTHTVDTAKAAVQAAELLQDSNDPDGTSDSVHNLEPIHIGNEDAPAVSPPRPVQQQQERRPVQREAAAIANNHHGNGDNRQLSAALAAAGAGDDVGNTSIDNGNGQDEENEDKKPSAKKP